MNNFIEQLLEKTDIVKLIGEYLPLNKKGGKFWGCCPFHHEKTPSFAIDETKQFYYCFGACKEGGNAITFIKKIESLESGDAIRLLAKKVGLEVPEFSPRAGENPEEKRKQKERLLELSKKAAAHYHNNLKQDAGKAAREYLLNRGIESGIITKFGIGFADGNSLIECLLQEGFTTSEMQAAGLAAPRADGFIDPFSNRIMIPIIDQFSNVVAFGGRTLSKNPEIAKYRNSPNTPIFEKNRVVFAANLLQRLRRKKNIDFVILCEGYMDVIALHKVGFDTAVACMGTALSINQAKQIKNFSSKVYISFDGDTAGQKNTLTSLDILRSIGLSVKVICMPEGADPDDVVTNGGAVAYQKLIDTALPLTEYKIRSLEKKHNLTEVEGRAKFAAEAVEVIEQLDNEAEKEDYFTLVKSISGYAIDVLKSQAQKSAVKTTAAPVTVLSEKTTDKFDAATKYILACLASEKEFVNFLEDFEKIFVDEFSLVVARFFVVNHKEKRKSIASLYESINDIKKLDEIINYEFVDPLRDSMAYLDCIKVLKTASLFRQKTELEIECAEIKDFALLKEKLEKIKQVDSEIRELKS